MLRTKTVMGLLLIVVFAGMVSTAWAQNQTDVFSVAYYVGGAGKPGSAPAVDGKVQIIYPGASSTAAGQYICADIYVFDPATRAQGMLLLSSFDRWPADHRTA